MIEYNGWKNYETLNISTKDTQTTCERFSDTELLGRLVGVRQAKSIYKGSLASVFTSADDKALAARELVKRWLCEEMKAGDALNSPGAVREYLKLHFTGREYESFVAVFLDLCVVLTYVENFRRCH